MFHNHWKVRPWCAVPLMVLLASVAAWAGGFWITLYSPQAPVAAKIADAVVVVAAEGCHTPADATLTGTAEGIVSGKRQSIPLAFTPTGKPGVYAVKKQWPAEGAWVLAISGAYLGGTSSVMVELSNGQANVHKAQSARGGLSAAQIEAALQKLVGKTT